MCWHYRICEVIYDAYFLHNILAALVEGTILCMHGGLSPDLKDLDKVDILV